MKLAFSSARVCTVCPVWHPATEAKRPTIVKPRVLHATFKIRLVFAKLIERSIEDVAAVDQTKIGTTYWLHNLEIIILMLVAGHF
jgi:hypothetical protein